MTEPHIVSHLDSFQVQKLTILNLIKSISLISRIDITMFRTPVSHAEKISNLVRNAWGEDICFYYVWRNPIKSLFSRYFYDISDHYTTRITSQKPHLKSINFNIKMAFGKQLYFVFSKKNYNYLKELRNQKDSSIVDLEMHTNSICIKYNILVERLLHNIGVVRCLIVRAMLSGNCQNIEILPNKINTDQCICCKKIYQTMIVNAPDALSLYSFFSLKRARVIGSNRTIKKKLILNAIMDQKLSKIIKLRHRDALRAINEFNGAASSGMINEVKVNSIDLPCVIGTKRQNHKLGYKWPLGDQIPTSRLNLYVDQFFGFIPPERAYRFVRRINKLITSRENMFSENLWAAIFIKGFNKDSYYLGGNVFSELDLCFKNDLVFFLLGKGFFITQSCFEI